MGKNQRTGRNSIKALRFYIINVTIIQNKQGEIGAFLMFVTL